MQNTVTLLDKYKAARGLASDNACAASLGITRAAVSRWRNGGGHPEAEHVEAMCRACGESLARWLPLIESERARTPEAKKVWLRLAQAAAAIIAAFLAFKHGSHLNGTEALLFMPGYIHYAQSRTQALGPRSPGLRASGNHSRDFRVC